VCLETDPNIGRVPTAPNREQLVCKDTGADPASRFRGGDFSNI